MWVRRLYLSFPRDPACFSALAAELDKGGSLRTLALTDMELHASDVAAVAGALVSDAPRNKVERLELLNCSLNARSLRALQTLVEYAPLLRDLVVYCSSQLDLESVRKFLKQAAAGRVCVELKLPESVTTADSPFHAIGVHHPVLLSQDYMALLLRLKMSCNVKIFTC